MRDIDAYSGSNITRAALQIHALTFQRPNEVSDAPGQKSTWTRACGESTNPHERNVLPRKADGDDHTVPLSKQAIAVLHDLHPLTGHGPMVFPSERGQGRRSAKTPPDRRCEAWAT